MIRQLRCVGVLLPVLSIALAGFSYAQDKPAKKADDKKPEAKKADDKKMEGGKDVVALISESKDHTTLAKLITAAGLTDTLKGKGPFTVFGPDDKAFDKLGKATVDEWMKPENKQKLKDVLMHHVVGKKVMAADLAKMKEVKTMNGDAMVSSKDGKTMIEGANITGADMAASNGVVHSIDMVLMPKAKEEKKGGHN